MGRVEELEVLGLVVENQTEGTRQAGRCLLNDLCGRLDPAARTRKSPPGLWPGGLRGVG